MFDIGGWEFLLIAILGIIIIGPKELPGAIRTVSMFVRRARELAREFQSGLEEVAREAELDKLTEDMKDIADPGGDILKAVENTIDPEGEIKHAMEFDREWRDEDLYDEYDGQEDKQIMPPAMDQQKNPPAAGESSETTEAAETTATPDEGESDPAAPKPGTA